MKAIFSYSDYRTFLQDHYEEKKRTSRSYSFRYFARRAGLGSPNYYKLVMDGQRNLTHRNILKFVKGLGLGHREALFFENLVLANQAKDDPERKFYQKNLAMIRSQDDRALLSRDQYAAYVNWHPFAIKELVLLEDFKFTPKWIASRFDFRITPKEAREAIELLERLGLVKVNRRTGKIQITKQSLQTPDVARSAAVSAYHKKVLDLAKNSIDKQTTDDRCLSTLTVAVRRSDLPEAFRRIHRFRNDMDTFFTKGKPYDSVYQLGIQLFRLDNDVENDE